MARTTFMALLTAVAVAGCGGNDDSASKTSAARGASGQQGTTGPRTGASGGTGTGGARPPKQTGKSKPRAPKKRRADRGSAGSGAPATPAPPPSTTPDSSLTPEQIKQLKGGMYKQARFLCKASTFQGLADQYGIKSGNVDDVARAWAALYPVGLRKTVAAGCKAGLLESK